jgi:hypothetical protein
VLHSIDNSLKGPFPSSNHPVMQGGPVRFCVAVIWNALVAWTLLALFHKFSALLPQEALATYKGDASVPVVAHGIAFWYLMQLFFNFGAAFSSGTPWLNSPRCNVHAWLDFLSNEKSVVPILLNTLYISALLMPLGSGHSKTSLICIAGGLISLLLGALTYVVAQHEGAPFWLRRRNRWITTQKRAQAWQLLMGALFAMLLVYIQTQLWFGEAP